MYQTEVTKLINLLNSHKTIEALYSQSWGKWKTFHHHACLMQGHAMLKAKNTFQLTSAVLPVLGPSLSKTLGLLDVLSDMVLVFSTVTFLLIFDILYYFNQKKKQHCKILKLTYCNWTHRKNKLGYSSSGVFSEINCNKHRTVFKRGAVSCY